MARSRYEYGTNPRKIQPEVERRKQVQKKRIRVVEDLPKQDVRISNKQKKENLVFILKKKKIGWLI